MILSALNDTTSKVSCLASGAEDYVSKPFSLDALLARVHARLRTAARSTPPFLRAGGVTLDLLRRQADVGDGPVPLAHREFLLLSELMRNAGRTVSKERLLSSVWGYHFDPGSNVVDVYVRRLRTKLGTTSSRLSVASAIGSTMTDRPSWLAGTGRHRVGVLRDREPDRDGSDPGLETVPFHFIWVSLTLLYGFRVWRNGATAVVLAVVTSPPPARIWSTIGRGFQPLTSSPRSRSWRRCSSRWCGMPGTSPRWRTRTCSMATLRLLEREHRLACRMRRTNCGPRSVALGHAELIQRRAEDDTTGRGRGDHRR
jgi:hypothetical protein